MKYQVEWEDQKIEVIADCDPLGRDWRFQMPGGHRIDVRVETLEEGSVLRLIIGGESKTVSLLPGNRVGNPIRILLDHTPLELDVLDPIDLITREVGASPGASGQQEITSLMPGIIRKIIVAVGTKVEVGTSLILLEAMKMENEIQSEVAGTVLGIHVKEGDAVAAGALMLVIKQDE
ncbi:MAG: biotin/lipoyl-binding protein [Planctomycetes bacterium]|nr:biotin/lipoyl-binding protein [Planctomycetota bacterium]MBT6453511.1 biotin/lipoyl-binding protein [Planctomycetota bacterium]MBT6541747.1 biotin/lipoyl-binding protein [Planctomycetota bacterium]MBT6784028.1 biotin/lipoyl-binding protein [Planctomycetota bacterium]MBT6967867.1 biotin/lipoyl-binding protein [Planctomycetota bacterium]